MDGKSVAAIILAGGQSSRFGTDKALFDFQGRPLITYVMDAFSGIAGRIIISVSPGNKTQFIETLGGLAEIIEDEAAFSGPLFGLKNSIGNISEEFVLLAPCDMPFLSKALYRLLLVRIDNHDASIPVINDYFEPIIGAYKTQSLRNAVKTAITKGEKKLSSILINMDTIGINEQELKNAGIEKLSFMNINVQP